jgi:NAD(P)-dependent dehydrogenase (short-subunit alcohol dehydrogenase family)
MRKVSLPGSLAVVTGGGSGIGRATAAAFAAEGARVLVVDIDEAAAKETVEQLGAGHQAYAADVSDHAVMLELAATIEREHGVPDVVVNNAGIGMQGRFLDTTAADWDAIIGVNLRGIVNGCAAFGPAMVARGTGQVVNVASGLGYVPTAETPAYSATKAAALSLSRSLRADWAAKGVGVSVICPGFINTPIATNTRYLGTGGAKSAELARKGFARAHSPKIVARAIVGSVKRNRSVVPVGVESWAVWYATRFVPTPVLDLVGRLVARGADLRVRRG